MKYFALVTRGSSPGSGIAVGGEKKKHRRHVFLLFPFLVMSLRLLQPSLKTHLKLFSVMMMCEFTSFSALC